MAMISRSNSTVALVRQLNGFFTGFCVTALLASLSLTGVSWAQTAATSTTAEKQLKLVEPEKPAMVEVRLEWNYKNFPLRIRAFELSDPMNLDLNRNFTVPNIQASPLTSELRSINVRKGSFRNFALVVQNDSDRDVYFYVSPHDMNPSTLSLGTRFRCLCYGHVYRAPAKMTWYRTVQMRAEKEADGSKLKIDHAVIGLSDKELEALKASSLAQ